ncbi:MAG: EF-P lysine aminoacylase EpmA, partial [Pseudomonadota bacterium]
MKPTASGDWRPTASLEVLKLRARMLERIRAFFSARGVLEVETPLLSAAATPDPNLQSLPVRYRGPHAPADHTLYLHTSPEFPMKRLLAAGSGPIYQLCKVFRDEESGRRHNPEFTMLEWYRVGIDHRALMSEVEALVHTALNDRVKFGPTETLTYREAFELHTGLDPVTANEDDFVDCVRTHGIQPPPGITREHDHSVWRDLLLTHLVEPRLGQGRMTFIIDYPATQASLARIIPGDPPVAARFELYVNGMELANGFHELADAEEQFTRFERQLHARHVHELPRVPLDERFLAALQHGLPDCAGVALGIDRLVMLAAGAKSIDDVIAFPIERA